MDEAKRVSDEDLDAAEAAFLEREPHRLLAGSVWVDDGADSSCVEANKMKVVSQVASALKVTGLEAARRIMAATIDEPLQVRGASVWYEAPAAPAR